MKAPCQHVVTKFVLIDGRLVAADLREARRAVTQRQDAVAAILHYPARQTGNAVRATLTLGTREALRSSFTLVAFDTRCAGRTNRTGTA